tara:strand:- start:1631 stop:2566 length:936 start_codon:yes stop_codon:yes gene_type:complete
VAILDLLEKIPDGFLGLSGDMNSGYNIYYHDGNVQNFDADTIGDYIGKGLGGIVFRLMDENNKPTNKVLKVVRILGPGESWREYALKHKSWEPLVGSKVVAMNQFQSMLMSDIANMQRANVHTPNGIPRVYSFAEGTMQEAFLDKVEVAAETLNISEKVLEPFFKTFKPGTHIAYWIMEYVPYRKDSRPPYGGFAPYPRPKDAATLARGREYRKEQEAYSEIAPWLLEKGWVVRDTINPDNFGFRVDGSCVFYDLLVCPYPPSREQGDLRSMANALMSRSEYESYERLIENGRYFNYRTQQGAYSAEEEQY